MISSSQVHIFTILSNIFNSFHAAATFRTKAKSSESVCCRKMKSEPRAPATMYISTRLFVCKKSAHLYLVFAPVTPLVSHWNGNCDSLELETLVSCTSLANSGEASGHSSSSRLKIVLSPPGAIS